MHALLITSLLPLLLVFGIAAQGQPDKGLAAQFPVVRSIATDLARAGATEDVEFLREWLHRAGDDPKALERAGKGWRSERVTLTPEKGRAAAAKRLGKVVAALAALLPAALESRAKVLAAAILQLDADSVEARAVLGQVRVTDQWLDPLAARWHTDRQRIAAFLPAAHHLDVALETQPREHLACTAAGASVATMVRYRDFRVVSAMAVPELEVIVRKALQAAAFSQAVRGGELAVPRMMPFEIVFSVEAAGHERSLAEALASGGINKEDAAYARDRKTLVFDGRGWVLVPPLPRATLQSVLLSFAHFYLTEQFGAAQSPPAGIPPCLVVGHLNWVAMKFLGEPFFNVHPSYSPVTTMAEARWNEPLAWAAADSAFASRSWARRLLKEGRLPPWRSTMADEMWRIRGADLVKATFVAEYLQDRGEFQALLRATSGIRNDEESARVARFQRGLGRSLDDFETEWRAWMLGPQPVASGLLQRWSNQANPPHAAGASATFVKLLSDLRAAAHAREAHSLLPIELDRDLSLGCRAHADYLQQNPDQCWLWPGMHEELSQRPGFSAVGQHAGGHSVIAFVGSDPAAAIPAWMGTFYHRLPLLDPGLFGVGFGTVGDIAVADVTSLSFRTAAEQWIVWPPEGMVNVPLAFAPEVPNPVAGASQDTWGYPITLQAFGLGARAVPRVRLHLHRTSVDGPLVDCHFTSPHAPLTRELVPEAAWCLIPEQRLIAATEYVIVAEWEAGIRPPAQWSFTTRRDR